MGIQVADLQKGRRAIEATVHLINAEGEMYDDIVKLVYRPAAYTPQREKELNGFKGGDWKSEWGVQYIIMIVDSWDLMLDDTTPLALTIEHVALVPDSVLGDIITAIAEDQGKARASSNAG